MEKSYQAVVIGGGVVGAAVLYHLAKFGWNECCLIERSVLTAGSSWHAAGGIHALNADPNMASLQAYTIDLLSEIEAESGIDIGLRMTGGISIASAPERWEWLQSAYRIFQAIGIDDCRLLGPDEIGDSCPILSTEGVLGGLWADREGYLDTTGTVQAYAAAARNRGATVVENNRVTDLAQLADGTWRLETEHGQFHAEHVVNAAGLWAKQVGRMAGLDLPLAPLQHHYFVTESVPEIEALSGQLPFIIDLEGFTYMRQDQLGMLVGVYETNPRHWRLEGAPWDFGFELFEEDTDRIANELDAAFRRYPVLQDVGVKSWVNGAFTFSPDGNPLVGPVRGLKNYWLACGVMAGFLQGGGVGKTLAEWMIHGESEADSWPMDIARYGGFASNLEYIRQTTAQFYARRFVMTFPNEQLWAGRPLRTSPAYIALSGRGARWGESWGLEIPIYFAPSGFEERPTLKRSNAFDLVGEECRNARNTAAVLDITGYSRFRVSGPGAKKWLERILAGRLPAPHRVRLCPMLSPSGRLRGDLTVTNWGDGTFWIMGSYYLREWHMRWFADHQEACVDIQDISDRITGFSIAGPSARAVLADLTDSDVDSQALPFAGAAVLDIGLVRAKVVRLSVTGELGYEINCPASKHLALYQHILGVMEEHQAKDMGFNALLSLRLEKSFGIWNSEFMQAYTPEMVGLSRWIDWDRKGYIGREAALSERARGTAKRLVTLEIDATEADASGYEPVWKDGKMVGFVTSGGYGHVVGMSLAMALLDCNATKVGTELSVHIVGSSRRARVIKDSPWDPEGLRMRS